MNKFEVGKVYKTRMIGDHNLICVYTVLKRTKTFVTLEQTDNKHGADLRVKIRIDDDGCEYCYPHGQYSKCTVLRADDDK